MHDNSEEDFLKWFGSSWVITPFFNSKIIFELILMPSFICKLISKSYRVRKKVNESLITSITCVSITIITGICTID